VEEKEKEVKEIDEDDLPLDSERAREKQELSMIKEKERKE